MKKLTVKRVSVALSLLAVLLSIGITVSYMFKETEPVDNEFERAVVSCEVEEVFNAETGAKSSVTVKNTGNIPAFVRVRIVSYWVNANGDVVGIPSQMPSFTLASGWTQTSEGTYRYGTAIDPEASTPNLLAENSVMTLVTDEKGNRQVVEIFAEAIQSAPDGAVDNWE